jgi:hypothetical protein
MKIASFFCPRETTREPQNGFSWNVILVSSAELFQHVPNLIIIRQEERSLYISHIRVFALISNITKYTVTCCKCDTYTWQRRNLFIRDKPILSSEKIWHVDYDSKGSVEKKWLVVSFKGLGAQTNWLAVNRHSWSNSLTLTLWPNFYSCNIMRCYSMALKHVLNNVYMYIHFFMCVVSVNSKR